MSCLEGTISSQARQGQETDLNEIEKTNDNIVESLSSKREQQSQADNKDSKSSKQTLKNLHSSGIKQNKKVLGQEKEDLVLRVKDPESLIRTPLKKRQQTGVSISDVKDKEKDLAESKVERGRRGSTFSKNSEKKINIKEDMKSDNQSMTDFAKTIGGEDGWSEITENERLKENVQKESKKALEK